MIRVKVLGVGVSSATMLVQESGESGKLSVLKRINVSSWSPEDISETQQLYKALTRQKIRYMVDLQKVTLQDSFLSIITSYYAMGNMETYLDDELRAPFSEMKVMQWMLAIANVIEQVQRVTGGCFYGLSLDRIFFCGSEPGLHVGLPMPRASYFKWLSERETLGVVLVREYPAEVLNGRQYDKKASDVWHLGLIGMKILSANTSYFNRSKDICALIDVMMDPSLEKRPTISDVVLKLKELLSAKGAQHSLASSLSSFFTSPVSFHRGMQPTAPSTDCSVSHGDNRSSTTTVENANCGAPETRPAPLGRTRHVLPPNWHSHALQQFEELQRLNAATFYRKSVARSPYKTLKTDSTTAATRHTRSPSAGTAPSFLQGPQGASASSLVQRRGAQACGPERRASSVLVRAVAPGRQLRSSSAFRSVRSVQENGKRWIDGTRHEQEIKRSKKPELDVCGRTAPHANVGRVATARYRRDEGTKNDIRRHIMQWKEEQSAIKSECNVIVNDKGDISVFFPKSSPQVRPPPPPPSQLQSAQKSNDNVLLDTESEKRQENARNKTPTPLKNPTPNKLLLSVFPARVASTYRERGISPRVPQTRANSDCRLISSHHNKSLGGEEGRRRLVFDNSDRNDLFCHGSDKGSEMPSKFRSSVNGSAMQISDNDGKKSSSVISKRQGCNCVCVDLLDSLDFSIKGLKLSIGKLLKDTTSYNKTLKVLETFAARPVVERSTTQFSVLFMNTIRKILDDDKLFFVVLPLCSQLMALEGFVRHFNTRGN